MEQMTEQEAIEHGLAVIGPDGVPAAQSPADRAERAAVLADELAAVVESILRDGQVTPAGLVVIRDGLGELHVEADMLAEEIRGLLAERPWLGAA